MSTDLRIVSSLAAEANSGVRKINGLLYVELYERLTYSRITPCNGGAMNRHRVGVASR